MFQKKGIAFAFIFASMLLTACLGEKEDPFTRLPEEPVETIEGRIFPFSVSVSTQSTHRLEKDEKLVAYLASNIVRLEDFEGREVEVEGVRRQAKMREVFWVESIRVQNIDRGESVPQDSFFQTRTFGFTHPEGWEYTTAPDGTAHFIEKSDQARRVFLTFSVRDLEKEDKGQDPNILIANMAGIQETSEDMGQNRKTITLFSNLYDRKYVFVFTTRFEDFERKTAFYKLLNSFVEGEANVRKAQEKHQKVLAAAEANRIKDDPEFLIPEEILETSEETSLEGAAEKEEAEEKPSFFEKLFGDDEEEALVEESVEEKTIEAVALPSEKEKSTTPSSVEPQAFTDIITAKAFLYESSYYGFSMKVPWGYWFRNFGQSESALARIGFADHDMSGEEDSEFWLEILGDQDPVSAFSEQLAGDQLILEFPRNKNSFFRFSGPERFRDAMLSIYSTIE